MNYVNLLVKDVGVITCRVCDKLGRILDGEREAKIHLDTVINNRLGWDEFKILSVTNFCSLRVDDKLEFSAKPCFVGNIPKDVLTIRGDLILAYAILEESISEDVHKKLCPSLIVTPSHQKTITFNKGE